LIIIIYLIFRKILIKETCINNCATRILSSQTRMSKGFAELQLKRVTGMNGPPSPIADPSQVTQNNDITNNTQQQAQN
jgi:hypothetical protein